MILKDFDITVYRFNKVTGNDELTPMVDVVIRGKVIIKREKKHYTVDCVKSYQEKAGFYDAAMLEYYIKNYLKEAKRIDEKWVLVGEVKDDFTGGKILAEKPIQL